MKKVLLIIFILSAFKTNIIAQSDSIEIVKTVFGMQYYKDNKQISKSNVISMLKSNPKSLELYDKGVMNCTFGNISGLIGGFFVGYQLGASTSNNKSKSIAPLVVGIGLFVVSLPLSVHGTKQKASAINLYNSSLKYNSKQKVSYNLLFNSKGVGLLVKF